MAEPSARRPAGPPAEPSTQPAAQLTQLPAGDPRALPMTRGDPFDRPDSVWNRAIDTALHAEPFCCRSEWQLSFHETFAPDRQLHLLERDGSVMLFAERTHPEIGALIEPIESHWLFACPLLGPEAVPMLAEFLAGHRPVTVLLSGLQRDSELLRQLITTFHTRFDILHAASNITCRAALTGGLDGYLSRRSAKHRRSVRNAARRANERGVTFQRHTPGNDAEADAVHARLIAIEEASWKGIGRCGMAESPSREFYAVMLRRLAESRAGRIIFAQHEGADIGFIFGGLCIDARQPTDLSHAVYRGQQFSFADDWRTASIGNLLQLEQIRWLCEEGVARYDMGPVMAYKHHWTEVQTPFETLALRPKS